MAVFGYARVSTADQDLSIQEEALRRAGCDIVRSEKASGSSRHGRSELEILLQFLRPGDTLMVTRVDRLARSVKDLQDMVHDLRLRGIALKATDQAIDTSTAAGKAFLDMLGVFAEFETSLRRERQMEGIAKAKARGVYRGRPPSVPRDRVIALLNQGKGPAVVARELGIDRTTVYRIVKRANSTAG
ncbi:recombinase family protein [Arenibaculum pallidiluteum]|uniref:recombinase family protein n=1 Tax=Arenibaculum pallidiluteum TaxID=2812559 RepID=UPI001A975921|nr:recombinase family protein [Arenibaculum pallidiluteum]